MSTPKLPSEGIECWRGNDYTKNKQNFHLYQHQITNGPGCHPDYGNLTNDVLYLINLGWPTTWGTKEYYFWRKKDE